jgi:hypothetical protein
MTYLFQARVLALFGAIAFWTGACGRPDFQPAQPEPENCTNLVDDDFDKAIDCDDDDCKESEICTGATCPGVDLLSVVGALAGEGSTLYSADNFQPSCGGEGANDQSFKWTAATAGVYTIDTTNSTFDTVLAVYKGGCDGEEVACNATAVVDQLYSLLSVALQPGEEIVIVVDGLDGAGGDFTLNINQTGTLSEAGLCDDGNDNDVDGLTDCNDPDCANYADCPSAEFYFCNDTLDNDEDGLADCSDSDCAAKCAGSEDGYCTDNLDNDQDGDIDCEDTDCINGAGCNGDLDCAQEDLGSAMGLSVATGNYTSADTSAYTGSCGGNGGEHVYRWTVPANAPDNSVYLFDSGGTNYDTIVYVKSGSCGGTEIDCNDDGISLQSVAQATLSPGDVVFVFVDSYSSFSTGAYTLNISGPEVGACDDGVDNDDNGLTDCDDPGCQDTQACPRCPAKDLGSSVGTAVVSADTSKLPSSRFIADCGGSGPELGYLWVAPESATYRFDTLGSTFDTVVAVLDGAGCLGTQLTCDNNYYGTQQSGASYALSAGEVVTVVVDGYNFTEGEFQLNIEKIETLCADSLDDDGDALIDCDDPDCFGESTCQPTCPQKALGSALGAEVASGTTHPAYNSQYQSSCGGTAAEVTHSFKAPAATNYRIDTAGSDFDTVIYILDGAMCAGSELRCSNDGADIYQSSLVTSLTQDQEITIVVDGFSGATGNYKLNIQKTETGLCTGGIDDDGDGDTDCDDEECFSDVACQPTCPYADLGSTLGTRSGSLNQLYGSGFTSSDLTCISAGAELGYLFSAPHDGMFTFDTKNSTAETTLYLLQGATCTSPEVDCHRPQDTGAPASLQRLLSAGDTVVAMVDSPTPLTGSFSLNVSSCEFTANQAGTLVPADCNNAGCFGLPQCEPVCPAATPPTPPTHLTPTLSANGPVEIATGTTNGNLASYREGTCGGAGPEVYYTWTAPDDPNPSDNILGSGYKFTTTGSSFSTVLYVLDGTCTDTEIICAGPDTGGATSIIPYISFGSTVTLVLDGHDTDDNGTYSIQLEETILPSEAGFCGDGNDNDGDTKTDCVDLDCFEDPACPDACPGPHLGTAVGAPVIAGTTVGSSNDTEGSCGSSFSGGGGELAFGWKVPATGTYNFNTLTSSFDTVLYLRYAEAIGTERCGDGIDNDADTDIDCADTDCTDSPSCGGLFLCTGVEIDCNDQTSSPNYSSQSTVEAVLTKGDEIAIFVDAYSSSGSGDFVLNIQPTSVSEESAFCTDGADNDGDSLIDCLDPDCGADSTCTEACISSDLGTKVVAPVLTGTTVGAVNVLSAVGDGLNCGGANAPEKAYLWKAPVAGTVTFSVTGTDFDPVLHLRESNCSGALVRCAAGASLVHTVVSDQIYLIAVDGADTATAGGAFTLNIAMTPDPATTEAGLCGDGIDNDSSGTDIDCLDTDCSADVLCLGACAGTQTQLTGTGPVVSNSTTAAATNDHTGTCGGSQGKDMSYRWTAPSAGTYTFTTSSTANVDTVLYLLDGACDDELSCNDNSSGGGLQSSLTQTLRAGQHVVVVVDGYASTTGGDFTLTISGP